MLQKLNDMVKFPMNDETIKDLQKMDSSIQAKALELANYFQIGKPIAKVVKKNVKFNKVG